MTPLDKSNTTNVAGTLWDKLNLKEGQEVVVVNAPESFAAALKALPRSRVQRHISAIKELTFVLVFVERKSELDKLSAAVIAKASADAVFWFAYPKGTSKTLACDFNRDKGWDVLRASGFDTVRQVSIDEDWSALRFRRTGFINRRSR
jgi:hypothetical protein